MVQRSGSPVGWRRTIRTAGSVAAFAVLPALLLAGILRVALQDGYPAWDFHNELYPQAELMLSGRNPYPSADFDPLVGTNRVWPPAAAYLVSPLTLLAPVTADVAFALFGLVCFAAALWLVGVRDWRVFGVVALWPPVFMEVGLSHLTPVLALLIAAAWRARGSRYSSGLLVGFAVALKLFVWPLGVWLVASGKWRAAAVGSLLPAISLLLVLPFTGLDEYGRALLRVGRAFDDDSYTIFGLVVQAGGPDIVARALTIASAAALVLATVRYRSFTLAVATALVASPIVWLDYFALAAVPLAIARPRLSPIWFVPLVTLGLEGAGWQIGDVLGTARVLGAFAVVLAVAFRAERAVVGGSLEAPRVEGRVGRVEGRLAVD
jgi:Glycosyltransferase family 87